MHKPCVYYYKINEPRTGFIKFIGQQSTVYDHGIAHSIVVIVSDEETGEWHRVDPNRIISKS